MDKSEMIWIASKYAEKNYNYDDLYYGDDLNGKEHFVDEIWEYVEEYRQIGSTAFREKYKKYKLY